LCRRRQPASFRTCSPLPTLQGRRRREAVRRGRRRSDSVLALGKRGIAGARRSEQISGVVGEEVFFHGFEGGGVVTREVFGENLGEAIGQICDEIGVEAFSP